MLGQEPRTGPESQKPESDGAIWIRDLSVPNASTQDDGGRARM